MRGRLCRADVGVVGQDRGLVRWHATIEATAVIVRLEPGREEPGVGEGLGQAVLVVGQINEGEVGETA